PRMTVIAAVRAPAATATPTAAFNLAGIRSLLPCGGVPAAPVPARPVPAAAVPAGPVPAAAVPAGPVPARAVPAGARPLRREVRDLVEGLVLGGEVPDHQHQNGAQGVQDRVEERPGLDVDGQPAPVELEVTRAQRAGDALVGGVEGAGVGGAVGVERTVAVDIGIAGWPRGGRAEQPGLDLVGREVRLPLQ